MENKENGYDFYKDYKPKTAVDEFEDLYSSSAKPQVEDIYSSTGGKHALMKKQGFGYKLKRWWKNRKAWQKASMITAVSILLIIAIIFTVIRVVFDYNYNEITENHEELGFEETIDKDIINVALFGIDTRDKTSFKGNSDSIMILSLNTETKQVKIVSILRDTLVPITYNGKTTYNKINSAYARGGPELAIKTLNTVFDLDISEYATVNFYGMADIIDAVGGIDAELTKAETEPYNGTQHNINGCIVEVCGNLGLNADKYYIKTPGVHHLNGIQAVAYARIRYVSNIWGTSNDYGRTDRQRYVMEQLFNKALNINKTQYPKLAKALIPCSETSLSYSEILSLAFSVLLHSPSFSQSRIPQENWLMSQPNAGVGSVVYYDLDFATKVLHSFLYEDISFDDYIAQNGIQKNNWFASRGSSNRTGDTGSTVSQGTVSGTVSDNSSVTSSDEDDVSSKDNSSQDGNSSDKEKDQDGDDDKDTSSGNESKTSSDTDSSDGETSSKQTSGDDTGHGTESTVQE